MNPQDPCPERCSGCGETPCPLDSDGLCPSYPGPGPDLSWGDYDDPDDLALACLEGP